MPISGKEMAKLFMRLGYKIVPGGGKGNHMKFKKNGCETITIPNHKELSTGMEQVLMKKLKKAQGE